MSSIVILQVNVRWGRGCTSIGNVWHARIRKAVTGVAVTGQGLTVAVQVGAIFLKKQHIADASISMTVCGR